MALSAIRYGIPLVLLIAGTIITATAGRVGIAAGALFFSAVYFALKPVFAAS